MHLHHFLTFIQYEGKRPPHINEGRWGGMLRWYWTRLNEGWTPLRLGTTYPNHTTAWNPLLKG